MTYEGPVAVPAYVMPAPAPQCSTPVYLDTLDSRFVNASTQRGNSLWNVQTTSFDPTTTIATPRFYNIDTPTRSVVQTGQFWFAGNSSDWNASISVNQLGEATLTWTTNESGPCVSPQVRSTGYQPGDSTGALGPGTRLATSPSSYDPGDQLERECAPGSTLTCARWGDYSAVSPDPSTYGTCSPGRRMWLVNEKNLSTTSWGSQIAQVGWC